MEKNNIDNGNKTQYDTNHGQHHDDDLLIVLDMYSLTSAQNSDAFFNPKKFFSQQHEKPVLVLDEKKLKQYNNDIDKAINAEITKQVPDTKKINNVKVIDIQHSEPYSGLVEAHNNDMCIELVKAINQYFKNIKRTKLISTSCHSETIDKTTDLRVELYNAVNGREWKQEHKLDLYLTPFNEINGKFKLNDKGDKIKQHIRLMNTKLAPSLNNDMTQQQKKDAQEMLQFMMNGQVYSYIKDKDGKAKMSLHIREYEPDATEQERQYTFVSLKRKKTEKDQGKKTLKDYCTLKEMSEFLQEYYEQCEEKVNEYFKKYPNSDEKKMKKKLVGLKYRDLRSEKIKKNDITNKKGQKWYDDKRAECQQKKDEEFKRRTSRMFYELELTQEEEQGIRDRINTEYNEDEYVKEEFISQQAKEYEQSLENTPLSEQETIQASKAIALHEGLDDIFDLRGEYVRNIKCYLPRKIENVQIEKDDNHKQNKINNSPIITEQGKQRKIENVQIEKDDNYKQNKINNLPVITEKEEGNNAGCCNRCCNLF